MLEGPELVLDRQTWYLGRVSTVHIYCIIYSVPIYMDHWFGCDSSRLVMYNSIPIYFIFLRSLRFNYMFYRNRASVWDYPKMKNILKMIIFFIGRIPLAGWCWIKYSRWSLQIKSPSLLTTTLNIIDRVATLLIVLQNGDLLSID